jgi:membrane dipeptidase
MRAGGIDATFFIVYTAQGELTEEGFAAARQAAEDKYQAITRMVRGYSNQIGLATSADEIEEIAGSGRLVALMGMENAYPLGPTLDDLEMWRDRGVRYVSLTHFGHNQFAGSSNPVEALGDSEEDGGLTGLGRELVSALNDLGIMVDVSHVGRTSMMEAVALSRAPVIASHSGAYAVNANPRNLDDDQLRAIRDNGGVAQMVAFRSYLRARAPEHEAERGALRERFGIASSIDWMNLSDEQKEAYRAEARAIDARYPDVTVSDLADHIDHAVEVAGIDHVGIASDFDGGGGVLGWDNAAETLNVTEELLARGYTEADLRKLWGGNVLRVMRAAEAAATR